MKAIYSRASTKFCGCNALSVWSDDAICVEYVCWKWPELNALDTLGVGG